MLRLLLLPLLLASPTLAAEPDFARDVQPLFAKHCVRCHGPKKQESGLRLDRKANAFKGGDSGKAAIVAKNPAESRLLQLVRGDDPEKLMPPDGAELTAAEIDTLTRWIEAGAAWPDDGSTADKPAHWSFIAPVRPAVPAVKNADWPRNAIDAFILARLEKEGLAPNPEADRRTLIRRVSRDLIGLPPSPTEVEAFVNDPAPDAYEKLVDRLLASPHYGERWARRWLDLARYSDTNGYEKDRARSMWPWRDWVIHALNDDMPFDQFTIEQLAGDLVVPRNGLSPIIATGFHRNTMTNEEGGIDVEEFRFHSVVDRVGTTGTVWLGLTVACAQCHTHKYDPISHREYYGLFSFFNNCDEPELTVPDETLEARRAVLLEEIAQLERELPAKFPPGVSADERLAAWRTDAAKKAVRWAIMRPRKVVAQGGATMTINFDGSVLASGDKPNRDTYEVTLTVPLDRVSALRLEVLPDESLPDHGPGRAPLFSVGDFLLSEFTVDDVTGGKPVRVPLGKATESYTQKGRSAALATDGDLDTGWSIQGRTGEAHQAVFPLAVPLVRGEIDEPIRIVVTLSQHYIHQMTIGRFRLSATDAIPPAGTEVRASGYTADIEDLLLRDPDTLDESETARLRHAFFTTAPELAEANKQIAALRKQLPQHPTTLVMQERTSEHARKTHRHARGEFLKPEEDVEPGIPAVLPPLTATDGAPPDRLAFARWLVAPENPLTARVLVNRHWETLFGHGLVRTSEDFGTQSSPPSHPELLDWLALEVQGNPVGDAASVATADPATLAASVTAWSLKTLHRLIVTSATYRQASIVREDHLARDPENALLARFPRLRLEAELLRDQALAVSGLLNPAIGGPSVYPPQPEGVTQLAYGKPSWPTSEGPDRYRRGLYTYAKRTSPYATFLLFDAGSGEACLPKRTRSNAT